MLQQLLATPRNLEEIGLSRPALQAIPLAQRRRALKLASGFFAPWVRKRSALPLVAEYDPEELDASGMTGGASISWSLVAPASKVQDVSVKFTAAGSAPGDLLAFSTNVYAGAYGSTFNGPTGALAADGALVIDGQQFTISGAVAVGDVFTFSTVLIEPGVSLAVCQLTAWSLLHNRGVDAKTEADLQRAYDAAMAFAKALGAGEADLAQAADATPDRAELGPLGNGQRNPWDFLAT